MEISSGNATLITTSSSNIATYILLMQSIVFLHVFYYKSSCIVSERLAFCVAAI